MGLELIIFIGATLFGILIYWRESNSNGFYRFINKLAYSKKLQMKENDKKGFVYQQAFLPRLVFVAGTLLLVAVIIEFLTPISIFSSYNGISAFSSVVVGVLVGTYVANFVFKSGEVIDEKSDSIEDVFHETVEKGKDFIEDLKTKGEESADIAEEKIEDIKEDIKEDAKSARDRLKDKGLL